jgi:hypothetical protein
MRTVQPPRLSTTRRLVFGLTMAALVLLVGELLASTFLLYRYRSLGSEDVLQAERGPVSLLVIAHKLLERLDLVHSTCRGGYEYAVRSEPGTFHRLDDRLGYAARPGRFTHLLMRRRCGTERWETLRVDVTIEPDGSRWTGAPPDRARREVFAFGDRWLFGYGVHDEQTWAWHLQRARPDLGVRLHALSGYALGQALLRFRELASRIGADDIVILGYADFYDERHVVAPSRLRWLDYWRRTRGVEDLMAVRLPRFDLAADGSPILSYVEQDCARNGGYCDRPDPDRAYMSRVSAALINTIARETPARVLLLRIDGSPDNPVYDMLDGRIEIISVLPGDLEGAVRDDIAGFDDHPGPYWHYAVGRKLVEFLSEPTAAADAGVESRSPVPARDRRDGAATAGGR